ncbi:PREDICTED: uncharacterized protein LOC109164750 [Ipomoea nil]|uniref:uncharacterized protein LOC109164750 n=1 Tax=Ipomoea nil TaxID=35883 RepID=UPI00090110E7|nr:PREDICTED: uncharacterized protein LOC109164750 [Ipomoea nil]
MDFVWYGMELITQKAEESRQDYTDSKLNIVQPRKNEQESTHKPFVTFFINSNSAFLYPLCQLQFRISLSALSTPIQHFFIRFVNSNSEFLYPDLHLLDWVSVVFHRIIASLEKLYFIDSNYYSKALRVLEAVAKYRLCVVLLDFDYVLAVNVFQLFLKIIRYMVDIMSQLIEERDEVSLDFQVSILDSLRKETLATAPCSTILGSEVLEKCAAKLKPCLLELMTNMNMNLDDYSKVLGSILHEVPEGENMVENAGSVPPVEGTSALQLPQVPLLDATQTMNNNNNNLELDGSLKASFGMNESKRSDEEPTIKKEQEKKSWSSLDINATSIVLALPAVTGKESATKPDVLAPSSTKSPCKRGQRKKNQTDLTVQKRYEGTRSAQRKLKEKDSKKLHTIKDYGKELVGTKVKVWWPRDRRFYEGVISSFNPKTEKHKVIYTDDDVEILNLRCERWELLEEVPVKEGLVTD